MNVIITKEDLAPKVVRYVIQAPEVARSRHAGQFVILRVQEGGERFPLTIADADPQAGTITLVVQEVGKSTALLNALQPGDTIANLVGPLGSPTHIERVGHVVCVGGGIGIAPLYPIAQAMKAAGNRVTSILGARTQNLLILEAEMGEVSDQVICCTDDGSYGEAGVVTGPLGRLAADASQRPDLVVVIGPPIMMKFCAETTRPYGIQTVASLNPVMVDGTGMCGGCRVTVGKETRFVCVDGPEFDAHQVDFDELISRSSFYNSQESHSMDAFHKRGSSPSAAKEQDPHTCRLNKMDVVNGEGER